MNPENHDVLREVNAALELADALRDFGRGPAGVSAVDPVASLLVLAAEIRRLREEAGRGWAAGGRRVFPVPLEPGTVETNRLGRHPRLKLRV